MKNTEAKNPQVPSYNQCIPWNDASHLACLYPAISIPQTVTPYGKINILRILSSITNETTELTRVSTVSLENEPGIRGDHSTKFLLGLLSGRREGSAGWTSASGWLDPHVEAKKSVFSWSVLDSCWKLGFLLFTMFGSQHHRSLLLIAAYLLPDSDQQNLLEILFFISVTKICLTTKLKSLQRINEICAFYSCLWLKTNHFCKMEP